MEGLGAAGGTTGGGGGGIVCFPLDLVFGRETKDLGLGVEKGRVLTDIAGRTGRGVVALSGRAGRDSSLGNGGNLGLNTGGKGCGKQLFGRVGNLGLGQTRGITGWEGLLGRGTTGLIPTIELADDELDWGECGHDCVTDTDLVASSALTTLILSCDRSESSDNVTFDVFE